MIQLKVNRAVFLENVGNYLKAARRSQNLSCAGGRLYLSYPGGGMEIACESTGSFRTTIPKGNMQQIIKWNKTTETLLEQLTLVIAPDARRLKSVEVSVNVGKVILL